MVCPTHTGPGRESLSLEQGVSKFRVCPSDSRAGKGGHVVRSTVTGIFLLLKVAHLTSVQLWMLESLFSLMSFISIASACWFWHVAVLMQLKPAATVGLIEHPFTGALSAGCVGTLLITCPLVLLLCLSS